MRRPLPTLFHHPNWAPENLKPVTGRTYGTPGEHLELTAANARRQTILIAVRTVIVTAAILAAATLGLRWVYFSDIDVWSARLAQALLIAVPAVALYGAVPWARLQELRAERGRNLAGLEGERRVAALLEELPPEYRIIHGVDITSPDGLPEDIDHVIVGPTGLILVDAKNWSGQLELTSTAITHNGRDETQKLIDGTIRRATQLTQFLDWDMPVRLIVCFTGRARVHGGLKNVVLTDRTRLNSAITWGGARLSPDLVKEIAEDVALLSPTATSVDPWRHSFGYLPPSKRLAHRLRFLLPPVAILRVPVAFAAAAAGAVSAYNLFHVTMSTGQAPIRPLLAGAGLAGGALATWGLPALYKTLDLKPQSTLPAFKAERAEDRYERMRVKAGVDAAPHTGTAPGGTTNRRVTTNDRAKLERIFTEQLILPPDTLEELVTVQLLLANAEEYKREWGQDLPYGLILHGPPGTGKTQIARTMSRAAGYEFHHAKPSELRSMWVGESAKAIAALYQKARESAPSVVFLDEIDAIASKRGAARDGAGQENNLAVNQLLQEIDGLVKHDTPVFSIGATNLLENLDDAIKSRLAYQIHIALPDSEAREKMFRKFAVTYEEKLAVPYEDLAKASAGMSGRDIYLVVQIASQIAYGRQSDVTEEVMTRAFERVGRTFALPTS